MNETMTNEEIEKYLRNSGWKKNSNGLWVDPDRDTIRMGMQSAFYSQLRRSKNNIKSKTHIEK